MLGCSSYCPGPIVWSVTSISSSNPTVRTRPLSAFPKLNTVPEGRLGDPQSVIHSVPMVATAQSE